MLINFIYCNKMTECEIVKYFLPLLLFLQATSSQTSSSNSLLSGFPVGSAIADNKLELKDEKQYANGTVVGKYSYTDNEGNPINIKYYADRSGYGVELNSVKIIESSTFKDLLQQPKINMDYMKPMEPLLDLASEILNFNNRHADKTDAKVNKNNGKVSQLTHLGKDTKDSNPYFETFYQNDIKAPQQCEKDKVKVYLVKENRKMRSAIEEDQEDQVFGYCEQF